MQRSLVLVCFVVFVSFFLGRASTYFYSFDCWLSMLGRFLSAYHMGFLSVLGWLAVFYANNYLQEKRIEKDKLNSARSDIVKSLRDYRNCLRSMSADFSIYTEFLNNEQELPENCLESLNTIKSDTVVANIREWQDYLSDYDKLFPGLEEKRKELQDIDVQITIKSAFLPYVASLGMYSESTQKDIKKLNELVEIQLQIVESIVSAIQQKFYGEVKYEKLKFDD